MYRVLIKDENEGLNLEFEAVNDVFVFLKNESNVESYKDWEELTDDTKEELEKWMNQLRNYLRCLKL